MNIQQMIRQEKSKITDSDLFSSYELRLYLEKKAHIIHKDFGIADVPTEIFYDEKSAVTAFTENSKYVLNTGHAAISGGRPEKYYQILGVHLHEIGHRLFTNFTAFNVYIENMQRGSFYPYVPECDILRKSNLSSIENYMKDPLQCKILAKVVSTLDNCIDDGRIEELLMNYCSQYRTQHYGLVQMREKTYGNISPLPDLLKQIETKERLPFEVLEQIILHYARFGEIKGLIYDTHKDEPIIKTFDGIQCYLDECLDAKDALTYYNALNKLIVHLWKDIFEYIEKIKDKVKEQLEKEQKKNSKSQGNNSQGSSGSQITQKVLDEIEKRAGKMEGTTAAPDPSKNTAGSGCDTKSVAAFLAQKAPKGAKPVATANSMMEETKSDNKDGQAPPYTRTSSFSAGNGTGEVTYRDSHREKPDPSMDINRMLNLIAEQRADDELEAQMRRDLNEFKNKIDFTAAHRSVNCLITRHKVTPEHVQQYNEVSQPIVKIAKNLAKKTDFFSEDDSPVMINNKYSGKKFNASSVARGDYRNFSKEFLLEEAPSVAVAVCIDESGSMGGVKCQAARRMAIMLYEYCDIMNIPVCIYGHTTRGSYGVEMFCYADFNRKDKNDRYRLMNITSRSSNRDGYPIRFLKAKLEDIEAENKLLFIISDGRPAHGDYTGTAANADLQDITRDCDKKGIALISAAIGSSKDAVNAIYGKNHYLDITDLEKLPITLTNKIKSLMK